MQPTDPNVPAREKRRLSESNQRLLDRLREGPAANVALVQVCGMRVSARVHDLRQHGYDISATSEGDGIWRYTLK